MAPCRPHRVAPYRATFVRSGYAGQAPKTLQHCCCERSNADSNQDERSACATWALPLTESDGNTNTKQETYFIFTVQFQAPKSTARRSKQTMHIRCMYMYSNMARAEFIPSQLEHAQPRTTRAVQHACAPLSPAAGREACSPVAKGVPSSRRVVRRSASAGGHTLGVVLPHTTPMSTSSAPQLESCLE